MTNMFLRSFAIPCLLAMGLVSCAFGQCLVVTPAGSGNMSGSDWNNAISGVNLPSNVSRGKTYYLAGGAYGQVTFNTPDNGSQAITIRAATASDRCTDTGWSASLAATPLNQVLFRSRGEPGAFAAALYFQTDYWILDGNGGWTNQVKDSGYNMKVDFSWPAPRGGIFFNGSTGLTIQYVEFQSFGLDLQAGDSQTIRSISCSNNVATIRLKDQRAHRYLYVGQWVTIRGVANAGFNSASSAPNGAQIQSVTSRINWTKPFTVGGSAYTCPNGASDASGTVAGPIADSDEGLRTFSTNVKMQYCYYHDGSNPIVIGSVNGFTVDHCAFERASANGHGFHSEIIADQSSTHLVFSNNLALDWEGTGYLVALGRNNTGVRGASWISGTATVVVGSVSQLSAGGYIGLAGIRPAGYNGVHQITAIAGNSVSYSLASNPGSYVSGGGAYTSNPTSDWRIYGNVFGVTAGNPTARAGVGDGHISCINTQYCTNFSIYNNTFSGPGVTPNAHWGFMCQNGSLCSGNVSENNLVYVDGTNRPVFYNQLITTEDYNSYLNLGSNAPAQKGPHDVVSNSIPDPFVNQAAYNFQLTRETRYLTGGVPLGNPYAIDPSGQPRGGGKTWDRGAFHFAGRATSLNPSASPPIMPAP